jgi:hypothetical protein
MSLSTQRHVNDLMGVIDISNKINIGLARQREKVDASFVFADKDMESRNHNGTENEDVTDFDGPRDIFSSEEYVYSNQKSAAATVTHLILIENKRLITIIKRTKSGANGFIFDLWRRLATHPDDTKVIPYKNIYILTGMSNKSWDTTMKTDCPHIMKPNIKHRNQMKKIVDKIKTTKNVVLIIDEFDVANGKNQTIYKTLENAGILDIEFMEKNNISIVGISATIYRELKQMKEWGKNLATHVTLEVGENYVGYEQQLPYIREWYPVKTLKDARRWVKEDIVEYFAEGDYRVSKIRVNTAKSSKGGERAIKKACGEAGICCYQDNSKERISPEEKMKIFTELTKKQHVVLMVKGFERRAEFWPTPWKLKTGALHDRYAKNPCGNVVGQSFPGRMSGYWGSEFESHKCGIIRTSVHLIENYIRFYNDPVNYVERKMTRTRATIVKAKFYKGLKEKVRRENFVAERGLNSFRIYGPGDIGLLEHRGACDILGYRKCHNQFKKNDDGFYMCKIARVNEYTTPQKIEDVIMSIRAGHGEQKRTNNHGVELSSWRVAYPCYGDVTNKDTLYWVLLIRPVDENKVDKLDRIFPNHQTDFIVE